MLIIIISDSDYYFFWIDWLNFLLKLKVDLWLI